MTAVMCLAYSISYLLDSLTFQVSAGIIAIGSGVYLTCHNNYFSQNEMKIRGNLLSFKRFPRKIRIYRVILSLLEKISHGQLAMYVICITTCG